MDFFKTLRRFFKSFERERVRVGDKQKSTWVLTIEAEQDELDGGWIASCRELQGCVSQGDTEKEALDNLLEAISGVIEARMAQELNTWSPSDDTTPRERTVRIAVG